jgi:hypothetical protein
MKAIKKEIREMVDFTGVSTIKEADEKFDLYLNRIKDAFKRMRNAPEWTMEDATYIYDFAISILTDRYIETLLKLDKSARANYKFFNE